MATLTHRVRIGGKFGGGNLGQKKVHAHRLPRLSDRLRPLRCGGKCRDSRRGTSFPGISPYQYSKD